MDEVIRLKRLEHFALSYVGHFGRRFLRLTPLAQFCEIDVES